MVSLICVNEKFDKTWPFAADHWKKRWEQQGETVFIRDTYDNKLLSQLAIDHNNIDRLVSLNVPVSKECSKYFADVKEAFILAQDNSFEETFKKDWEDQGTLFYKQNNVGFWGPSVAEFAMALTFAGLRRIPQMHHNIIASKDEWNYSPEVGLPSKRGHQFGDDTNFTNGTVCGKNIGIVGAGNIATRYASCMSHLGANVKMWDPFATDPCFHRSGAKKVWHMEQLLDDIDIFVPMVPLIESTKGLISKEYIKRLPQGTLVIMVTRAKICDCDTLYKRVINQELSLAADVFDIEPLPLDHPLLNLNNVVHTPHNAGRTKDANFAYADAIIEQFKPM